VSTHPVRFEADYVERRSRLTTFFRLVLVIPHAIVLYLWTLAAYVVAIIAWFAIVITGRWPRGLYDFSASYWRYGTAVLGYTFLLTDEYPPFGSDVDDYPVRLLVAPPKERYSRLKALFRIILAIPVLIIAYAMQIVAAVGALLAWFAIVVLGRQPKALQDMIVLGVSYQQRSNTYVYLLTEDWPPFTDQQPASVEPGPTFGALPSTPPAAAAGPEPPAATTPTPLPPERPHGDPLGEETTQAPPDPPAPEPSPEPPAQPERTDEDEPPPGPFGPSSTQGP
jgi:Domain of unknown function (DUF4389)